MTHAIQHYRVQYGKRKVGIIGENYREVIKNCKKKFSLKESCQVTLRLMDHTEVDEDFFPCVESQETLFLSAHSDTSSASHVPATDELLQHLGSFLMKCSEQVPNLSGPLQEVLAGGQVLEIQEFIAKLPLCQEGMLHSTKKMHPQWFEGAPSRHHLKEAVLRGSAECRVRGYFTQLQKELRLLYQTDDHTENTEHTLQSSGRSDAAGKGKEMCGKDQLASPDDDEDHDVDESPSTKTERVLNYFKEQLKLKKYQQSYFDRSAVPSCSRLCDSTGLFPCDGQFDHSKCELHHAINPYASRENRIVFSSWNLDHMIEKSRSVIPKLKELVVNYQVEDINLPYFFDLLFSKYRTGPCGCKAPAEHHCCCCGDCAAPAPVAQHQHKATSHDGQKAGIDATCGRDVNVAASSPVCTKAALLPQSTGACHNAPLVSTNNSHQCRIPIPSIVSKSTIRSKEYLCRDVDGWDELDGNACFKKRSEFPPQTPSFLPSALRASPTVTSSTPQTGTGSNSSSASSMHLNVISSKIISTAVTSSIHCQLCLHRRPWPGNLKLVHIACHDKKEHNLLCDDRFVLLRDQMPTDACVASGADALGNKRFRTSPSLTETAQLNSRSKNESDRRTSQVIIKRTSPRRPTGAVRRRKANETGTAPTRTQTAPNNSKLKRSCHRADIDVAVSKKTKHRR